MSIQKEKHVISGKVEPPHFFTKYKSIGEFCLKRMRDGGNKVAFIDGVTAEELTFKQILDQSLLIAKAMQDLGIKKNDTVSIVSENRLEFPAIVFAIFYLGAKLAPINPTYTEREMQHAFNLSKPKMIFTSPYASQAVVNVAKSLSYVQKLILLADENPFDGFVTLLPDLVKKYQNLNFDHFEPEPVDIYDQVCLILCSSGTTGLPKGVQLTHANLMASNGWTDETVLNLSEVISSDRVIMGLVPWFHAYGCTTMIAITCTATAVIIILPKFEEGLFLSCIENYKITMMFLVPPLMVFLAKHPMVDNYDLTSICEIVCGAAPLSKEIEEAVKIRLKSKEIYVRNGFGMSELCLATTLQKTLFKPGSVGDLNSGTHAKIIDEAGNALGPNKPGELCIKGSQNMKGYIGNDEATRDTIDKNGWLHTGDVAYYDEDEQFFIIDRIKELIKYNGFQVPPAEIEGILLTNPKIKDAAVIGIPDERAGELPLAFVVKQPGVTLTESEVIEFVRKIVSKPKQLHGGCRFLDEIPKNPSGKILRRKLREIVQQQSLRAKL